MPKSKEPKTHFEQVSLEIVKQIVDEEISSYKANGVEVALKLLQKSEQYFRLWVSRGEAL